jgi:hypothetical protein
MDEQAWQQDLNDKRNKVRGMGFLGCPEGWKELVVDTDNMLAHIDPEYFITQVKEKFGSLRYYYDTKKTGVEAKIMEAIVSNAEALSRHVCEKCGSYSAELRGNNWVRTLCEDCYIIDKLKRNNRG